MFLTFIFFALTRLLSLANYPHFFDAPEYLALSNFTFGEAIRSSHDSLHPVSYLVWQLARTLVPGDSVWPLSLVSVIAALLSGVVLVKLARTYHVSPVLALLALTFFSNSYLLETNLAHEPVTHLLMICCWYFWLRHLNNNHLSDLALAIGLGGAGLLNYVGLVIWLPLFALITYSAKPTGWLRDTILGISGIILSWLVMLAITAAFATVPLTTILSRLMGQGLLLSQLLTPANYLSLAHQALVAFGYGYTYFSLIIPFYLFLTNWRKRNWLGVIMVCLVGAAYFVSVSWWHGGLYGRLGGLVAYPLALGLAKLPRAIALPLLVLIFVAWIPVVRTYRQVPFPELTRADLAASTFDILIISDLERPQLSPFYPEALPLNNTTRQQIEQLIMNSQEPVLVTSQALTYPYRQYDGQLAHPLPGSRDSAGWLEECCMLRIKEVEHEAANRTR